jgi:dihydroorotate dehydrogenase electron transfer subunit
MLRMPYTVTENAWIAKNTWRMTLAGDTSGFTRPGQFVQFRVPGFYLRRPISVCDWDHQTLTLIYKTVGHGTEAMARMQAGDEADLLAGLGNGFTVKPCHPVVIGGGVGVPPLYRLCRDLLTQGIQPAAVLGFNAKDEIFYTEEFEALGAKVTVTTVDGSSGIRGYVTQGLETLPASIDYTYACGPMPMLRAVYDWCGGHRISGQFSLEERMACGFGACMGCTIQTANGPKRVCADGPVFLKEELLW